MPTARFSVEGWDNCRKSLRQLSLDAERGVRGQIEINVCSLNSHDVQ
jgi:hypothetical protein